MTICISGLETKFLTFERGACVAEDGRIEGYASIFGVPDHGGDVVEKGAFDASLKALSSAGRSVKLLWQHDPAEPIGVWDSVFEDGMGLVVRGRLLSDIRRGAEALALIRAGAIDGLSIGYRATKAVRDPESGGRRLQEVELWEVSLVTFPMLPEARAAAQASEEDDTAEMRALAEALAEARGRFA